MLCVSVMISLMTMLCVSVVPRGSRGNHIYFEAHIRIRYDYDTTYHIL